METHVKVKHPKLIASILMVGAFIGLFSETALNMALSNIMEEFVLSPPIAQWLTTGYLLVLGILVPISALLMKWFSTKQLVVSSLLFAIMGTVLGALSSNFFMLLSGRLIQAIGTGLLLPVMMSVILLIFPMNKRGVMMGIMGMVITAAPALGPTVSGFIISTLDWTYIFWISALLYFILLIVGYSNLENVSDITKPKIDLVSVLLSTIGFGGTIFALSTLAESSFGETKVWLPLIIGLLALILFSLRQFKMEEPMINLRVFQYPMFTMGTILLFISMLIILSTAILLPLYLKGALLVSALSAGLLMLPGNIVNMVMAPVVGGLFDKLGARKFLIAGFLFVLLGNGMLMLIISATTPLWQIVVACILLFLGISMIIMPAQTNGLNQLPRELYGDGSAVMNTLNQVAGAIGTAVAITLYMSGQTAYMEKTPDASVPAMLAGGTQYAFYFITGISAIGLAIAFFVKRK